MPKDDGKYVSKETKLLHVSPALNDRNLCMPNMLHESCFTITLSNNLLLGIYNVQAMF